MDVIEVQVGQVWENWDARVRDDPYRRKFKIINVTGIYAHTESLPLNGRVGRRGRIRLDRFKPNATGYRLIQDTSGTRDNNLTSKE